jgi:sialic acid synthase SpsE
MNPVHVGLADIGHDHPTYVIAEIGSNHDDDIEQAKLLIRSAAHAGANCAKFQFYRADELYPGQHTPHAIPDEWLPILKAEAWEHGLEFMCSVFSIETLDTYMKIEPAAIKIASPEASNFELLKKAWRYGIPMFVSTGAMNWDQAEAAAKYADIILHCVSAYPAQPEEMNLSVIPQMADYLERPVGLSDHTLTRIVPELAVAAGASVIEKHLTLDRNLRGPDHAFAMTPHDFKGMVRAIRRVEQVMGDGVKRPTASEDPTDRRVAA